MELLSPAGGMPALTAALDAGADAVYLGLKYLNARAGAANFTPEELREACRLAHAKNARVYLTLNIDLAQRELGLAARCLAVAAEAGVDAVLFRDPAILAMRDFFPQLDFHFSTQAGVSSSAGVMAGKRLGLSRVVLARELSFEEIRACCAAGVDIEVFGQGALCFCCSGRCLLSSWGGGRSGNRGACASPCRILWTASDGAQDRFLSMHDLCVLSWVERLREIGVASLKIEGRLKSPSWVSRAVSLYRQAIDKSASAEQLREKAEALGNYTGRQLTDGYLKADREHLTGDSRRRTTAAIEEVPAIPLPAGVHGRRKIQPMHLADMAVPSAAAEEPAAELASEAEEDLLHLSVRKDEKGGLLFLLCLKGRQEELRIPPQRIVNARRATTLQSLLDEMRAAVPAGLLPEIFPDEEADGALLLPRSAANHLLESFVSWLRIACKEDDGMPRNVSLPEKLRRVLTFGPVPRDINIRHLGDVPDTLRLLWNQPLPRETFQRIFLDVFPCSEKEAEEQAGAVLAMPNAFASLPQVCYEQQLPALRHLLRRMKASGRPVEINSWDAWQLAKEEQVEFTAGNGLAVLNALAARQLAEYGCREVAVSMEIDKEQLEAFCAAADVPLSLTVFAWPALMTTRAKLPEQARRGTLREARKMALHSGTEGELTVLRPEQPMDWRRLHNSAVRVAHLVMDLRGMRAGAVAMPPASSPCFLFNYDRRLR